LQHIGIIAWAKDLLLRPSPLRLVDTIYVILNLHNDAAIRLGHTWTRCVVEETLGFLECERAWRERMQVLVRGTKTGKEKARRTTLLTTRVNLEHVLVSEDIDLDTGEIAAESRNGER